MITSLYNDQLGSLDNRIKWTAATVALGSLSFYVLRRRISSNWGVYKAGPKNMDGKVVIVTGANVGLGYYTALELAKKKATVIMACRDQSRANEALKDIQSKSGNDEIFFMKLDLGSLASVKEFASEFLGKFDSLHRLVCNAGVWMPMEQKKKTSDGYEIHFGVNHLGHFLLVDLLKDVVKKSDGRIVLVSSLLMMQGKVDMVTKDFMYEGRAKDDSSRVWIPTGYADSKLMNALTAKELSKRDLECVSVCPGWCSSELARYVDIPWYKKALMAPIALLFRRSTEKGSENILQAILDEKVVNGAMYRNCRLAEKETNKVEGLEDVSAKLWDLSMELINKSA